MTIQDWGAIGEILGAVATIEAGMKAVGIDHKSGGAEAAASVIAEET